LKHQKHCPGCFQDKSGLPVCPKCGYDEDAPRSPLFLPHGALIGGQYRVGRVLGRPGGFGITYLGWDQNLQARVAIKEYLPRELALRTSVSPDVVMHSDQDRIAFDFGKDQFLREARIVAQFDHPNVVRVRNFFNAHGTAYLVMDYYEGMSLGDYLTHVRSTIDADIAVPLIKPILDGLQYVHERGVVHRDLKPHNIYLATVGRAILLDFGAARQAVSDKTQSVSVVLTEGYAPLEQYQRRAGQGAPTDVYGVAATLYRMITGQILPIALDRLGRDPVEDGGYAQLPSVLRPILHKALAVRAEDRYQTALAFREALDGCDAKALAEPRAPVSPPAAVPVVTPEIPAATQAPAQSEAAPAVDIDALVATMAPQLSKPVEPTVPTVPTAVARPVPPPAPPAPVTPKPAPKPPPSDDDNSETIVLSSTPPPLPPRSPELPPIDTLTPNATEQEYWNEVAGQPITVSQMPQRLRIALALIALVSLVAIGWSLLNPVSNKTTTAVTEDFGSSPVRDVAKGPAPPAADAGGSSANSDGTGPVLVPVMVELPGTVGIKPFRMELTEVTVAQFRQFVERAHYGNPRWQNYPCESLGGRLPEWDNPGYAQDDDFPVVCVSRADARAYAAWLSRVTGSPYRLPTEAEWEYAARGGSTTAYWWGNSFQPVYASCADCPPKQGTTNPDEVRSRPANGFGLFDTAGNVREWSCSAAIGTDAAHRCAAKNDGGAAVLLGGSWRENMDALRSDHRAVVDPDHRDTWTGFRLALEIAPSAVVAP
jgi:formylglycine-generating enzyme required for sulfatase activity/serine/threonine protein kinase